MSLLDYEEKLMILDIVRKPDGYGGTIEEVIEIPIMGGVFKQNTEVIRIAEQQGAQNFYTVSVNENVNLKFGDIIKRAVNGEYLEIKTKQADTKRPKNTNIKRKFFNAEETEYTPS